MLSGDIDYMLKCVAPDLTAFQEFVLRELTAAPNVASVKTTRDDPRGQARGGRADPGHAWGVTAAKAAPGASLRWRPGGRETGSSDDGGAASADFPRPLDATLGPDTLPGRVNITLGGKQHMRIRHFVPYRWPVVTLLIGSLVGSVVAPAAAVAQAKTLRLEAAEHLAASQSATELGHCARQVDRRDVRGPAEDRGFAGWPVGAGLRGARCDPQRGYRCRA